MGLTQSITKPFRALRHHTTKDTLRIIHRYMVSDMDSGLNAVALAELLNPKEKDIEDAYKMVHAFRGDRNGKVPILSLLAGLLCISLGKTHEKVRGLFQMADFDRDGKCTPDELNLLLMSCQGGIQKMTGSGANPDPKHFYAYVQKVLAPDALHPHAHHCTAPQAAPPTCPQSCRCTVAPSPQPPFTPAVLC